MAVFQYFIKCIRDDEEGYSKPDDYWFYFRYLGSGTIKYMTITIDFINQVGDVFYSKVLKFTGPMTTNDVSCLDMEKYYFDYHYKKAIKSGAQCVARRVSAKAEFVDGTKKNFTLSDFVESSYKDKDKWWMKKSGGCYVATCVYGSYDCPEVWTLRRYRDNTLGSTWYGRMFIRVYYAISPTFVKWFGKTKWFKKLWRGKLDRMVKSLQERGVESTPYCDKEW